MKEKKSRRETKSLPRVLCAHLEETGIARGAFCKAGKRKVSRVKSMARNNSGFSLFPFVLPFSRGSLP